MISEEFFIGKKINVELFFSGFSGLMKVLLLGKLLESENDHVVWGNLKCGGDLVLMLCIAG